MEDAAVYGDPPPPEQKMVLFLLGRPVPHSGRVGALQTHFALPAFVLWMNTSVSRGFCGIVILGNVALFRFSWPRGSANCLGLLMGLQLPVYLVRFWVSSFL